MMLLIKYNAVQLDQHVSKFCSLHQDLNLFIDWPYSFDTIHPSRFCFMIDSDGFLH